MNIEDFYEHLLKEEEEYERMMLDSEIHYETFTSWDLPEIVGVYIELTEDEFGNTWEEEFIFTEDDIEPETEYLY